MHTPGPWMIDPVYLSEVQTRESKTVASCWHENAAGRTITVTDVLECSLEESAANARLIAAAPDMLAALQDVLALPVAAKELAMLDIDIGTKTANAAWLRARAAIAKATGAQP